MTAVMRAFIVFLCVVAGLYIAMDDPFKDPTPAQYIRLAGTLSVLAFMVGYDSSRLEDWLALVPRPSAKNGSDLTARDGDDFLQDGVGTGERGEWGEERTKTPRRGARPMAPR